MKVKINGYEIGEVQSKEDTKKGKLVISIFDEKGRLLYNAHVDVVFDEEKGEISIQAPITPEEEERLIYFEPI